jgi:hypothetical protein
LFVSSFIGDLDLGEVGGVGAGAPRFFLVGLGGVIFTIVYRSSEVDGPEGIDGVGFLDLGVGFL